MKKLMDILTVLINKTRDTELKGAPRFLVYAIVVLTLLSVGLFLAAWSMSWLQTGKPELAELTRFFGVLTSASTVAAIGFFGRALVDTNDDGIPDAFEDKEDKR